MSDVDVLPELKQIVGALLFVAKQPLSVGGHSPRAGRRWPKIRGGDHEGLRRGDGGGHPGRGRSAPRGPGREAARRPRDRGGATGSGSRTTPPAGRGCGTCWSAGGRRGCRGRRWRRWPSSRTASRCMRSEIEAVRGVEVDQIIRNLLEMQLIRIVGRSELPGRPWLFGTTQKFLEHFGLKNLMDLPGVEELRRMEDEQIRQDGGGAPAAEGGAAGGGVEPARGRAAGVREEPAENGRAPTRKTRKRTTKRTRTRTRTKTRRTRTRTRTRKDEEEGRSS